MIGTSLAHYVDIYDLINQIQVPTASLSDSSINGITVREEAFNVKLTFSPDNSGDGTVLYELR